MYSKYDNASFWPVFDGIMMLLQARRQPNGMIFIKKNNNKKIKKC